MDLSSKQYSQVVKKMQNDPVWFAENVLGYKVWEKQKQVMESVRDNSYTIVRSGHGVGKTFCAASTILWFLTSFHPSKVITTAPTWNQVERVLWTELNHQYKKSKYKLGGEILQTMLRFSEDHFAVGFSTDDSDKFQGHHSPNILVVFDEAPGVRPDIWEAAKGLTTSPHSRFLAIGNPTTPAGPFYDAFRNTRYNRISISCLESPNVVNDNNEFPGLVTKDWIEDMKKEWGESSPIYASRVLGDFPIEGENTMFPLIWVERAVRKESSTDESKPAILGVDVARFGSDFTVLLVLKGNKVVYINGYNGNPTTKTAGLAIQIFKQFDCKKIMVDDVGVGGGVYDILEEQQYPVYGVNFGAAATDKERFYNLKTEIFWNLRQEFEQNNIDIPQHDRLIEELPSIMYEITSKGQMKVIGKDIMKKLGMKSPDYADALAIAHYGSYGSRKGIIDFYKDLYEETKQTPVSLDEAIRSGNIESII